MGYLDTHHISDISLGISAAAIPRLRYQYGLRWLLEMSLDEGWTHIASNPCFETLPPSATAVVAALDSSLWPWIAEPTP